MTSEARAEAERRAARSEFLATPSYSVPTLIEFGVGMAQWQAEQDHRDESEIAKVAAQRAVRISEPEALVDSLDRQIEARSGKTAAERIWCERAESAEAKLAKIRATVENPHISREQLRPRLLAVLDGESDDH